jgi:pyruvate/2-oxoglutarate dehydrogenase complex dihydrolipoamide dehydrogenase (E3) component
MNERYGEGDGDDEDVSGGGRGIMNDACMLRMLRNVKMYVDANRERIYEEDDSPKVLRGLGMDLALGRARLCDGGRSVIVTDENIDGMTTTTSRIIHARCGVVIATGASPGRYMFDRIRGLDDVPFWTYENLWDEGGFFDAVERNHMRGRRMSEMRVIVVGGGPVGCELSQSLSRLGCSVVLICGSARLLPNGEMEASAELKRVFKNEGIDVICDQRVVSVVSLDGETVNRSIMATLESHEPIIGDHILIATGRVPNVERMGLDDIGVKINPVTNGIIVDEKLQTSVKGVYAAGDCTGDRQFTHYAGFQGAIAARNILLPLKDTGVLSEVPSTTFTDPEVASFGLTEQAASDKYGEEAISISFRPLSKIDRAICEGSDGLGFIKIVYKTKTRQILGATVMAPSAGELVSELTAIQAAKMPLDKLATVMHSYPSYSIALQQMAAEVYYDKLKKNQSLYDVLKRAGL